MIDINGMLLVSGALCRTEGLARSVARASAAKVPIIRFTQSSWAADKMDSPVSLVTADTKVSVTAVILTVSWNFVLVSGLLFPV